VIQYDEYPDVPLPIPEEYIIRPWYRRGGEIMVSGEGEVVVVVVVVVVVEEEEEEVRGVFSCPISDDLPNKHSFPLPPPPLRCTMTPPTSTPLLITSTGNRSGGSCSSTSSSSGYSCDRASTNKDYQ